MTATSVLDASALLAWLLDEPGGDVVLAAIEAGACMSWVNAAEVGTRYALAGADVAAIRHLLGGLPFELIEFDAELAERTAALAPLARPFGLSLGDRVCLALAQRLGLPAITADRVWRAAAAEIGVTVRLIRPE